MGEPDLLSIVNGQIVTVDKSNTVINDSNLVVGPSGVIRAISTSPIENNAIETIDAGGGIVMPGLINAHTHMGMTLFRGLGDDISLEEFLARLMPAECRVLTLNTVRIATMLGAVESLLSGITTALDMYYFPQAALDVAKQSGMRILCAPNFLESDGPEPMSFDERMIWAREWLSQAHGAFGETKWIAPHSTYLLGLEHLLQLSQLAKSSNARVHVHASETSGEMQLVAARHKGKTPIEVLDQTELLSNSVLAHGIHLHDKDLDLIAKNSASVVHCPASNFKLASGVARIIDLQKNGVNIALGTDGPASGNDLDLWVAMRLAGYMQKSIIRDPTVLPAHEIVRMATINGARALHIDHLTGSIEINKQADLVILDADAPSITPNFDPHVTIATSASRAEVRDVIIGGRVVVKNHAPLTIDKNKTIGAVSEIARRVRHDLEPGVYPN